MSSNKRSYITSIILVGCLYFIFGFVTWLNSTLIFFFRKICELNNFQSFLVATAFFASYFLMALPSSFILRKTGFKKGMSLGLAIMAIGTIIFIPGANQRSYPLFLTGLFIIGLGLSILQTAVNPYVTILGPTETASKRISIMGISNKAAGFISPIILGTLLLKDINSVNDQLGKATDLILKNQLLNELASRLVTPYITFTIILFVFALLIIISPLPEVNDEQNNPEVIPTSQHPSLLKHTYLLLGSLAIFFYVGVEVLAGDSIIGYGTYNHIAADTAKYFTSVTLAFMIAGYLVGIALMPKIISQEKALRICCILAIVFCIGILCTTGLTSVLFLASLGFANAVMWPAIWPMSLKGLGKFTKMGAALLIMGIVGGAIIPPLYGWLADTINPKLAYSILLPCYLFILFFATKGYKIDYKEKPL